MVPGTEGGVTKHYRTVRQMSIAMPRCVIKKRRCRPSFWPARYGTGSSRTGGQRNKTSWSEAVVARVSSGSSLKPRRHGVLPLQFLNGVTAQVTWPDGSQTFSIGGLSDAIQPGQRLTIEMRTKIDKSVTCRVKLRIDTPIEIDYYRHAASCHSCYVQLLANNFSIGEPSE